MSDVECEATWKGKDVELVLRVEEDEVRGYVHGKTHVLTLVVGDDDELEESFCHDDLEYDDEEVLEAAEGALEAAEEEGDEDEEGDDEDEDEDEDEEEDGEEDEDEEEGEDEVDEDEDADYGTPVEAADIDGAPRLHALMVAYGSGIDVDGDIRIMRRFFETLQEHGVATVHERLLTGADASAQGTLDALSELEPGENDVVWFFYSGHGCMEEGDRLLCTHGKMLRRAAVVDALSQKSARFNVVLSDCCAVEGGRLSPEEKLGASKASPSPERLIRLFQGFRGFFDVSSSDDYQYSFGGVFTPTLIEQVLLRGKEETWEAVFERTQKMAMAQSEGALPADAKRKLRAEGKTVETHQKPVAFKLPEPM